ncbi:LysE family translocator [Craterilacuibacter sinensis]|uniref:LysE family transporter n=1 Tax=Craterilacuibacter sinensis TaxID=2686017 RepID=A0A845BNR5_9NEIS|nr:LysE family translocator [Craterilacuibacter sinensis]MXR35936.1 LysE family transporter [Craterilacuibacter sinensis]RQW27076.1 LysE family translocator [Rhodobacteraceae bacterium CH30]
MLEILALTSYMSVMSITPGPNNIMLASSGVNFGFRRTLPHMLGISLGCAFQLFVTAVLLGHILVWLGNIRGLLAMLGCTYLLYLSWKLAHSAAPGSSSVASQPLGFIEAALFQWINPKAWVMVINAAILFMPQQGGAIYAALTLSLLTALVNLPCIAVWALGGDRLRHHLQQPQRLRLFNLCMAMLMATTAVWMLWDELA